MWWELYTLGRLQQASQEASAAMGSAQRAAGDVTDMRRSLAGLEQQVERLTLATVAMLEILRDRHGLTEAEFEAKVREIDLRDGQLDGRIRAAQTGPRPCPACGRLNAPHRAACLYCASPLPVEGILK